eukprot:169918_1
MEKQKLWTTLGISIVAIVAAYVIFGFTGNRKDFGEVNLDQKPALSKGIPSYIGPRGWELTKAHKPYKTSKIFNRNTVPRGLTSRHIPKADVTELVHVIEGELNLIMFANRKDIETDQTFTIKKNQRAICSPQQRHKIVSYSDDVQFYVEFWKVPPNLQETNQ